MVEAAKKFLEPKSDYERLFDCDETRLAQGTGSHLLDDFLRIPVYERNHFYQWKERPETKAIFNADPATRGDIFARLCALSLTTSYNADDPKRLLPINCQSLSALHSELSALHMTLPSAGAFALLRRDCEYTDKGSFALQGFRCWNAMARHAQKLMQVALDAGERARDPEFDALLAATLRRYEDEFIHAELRETAKVEVFLRHCLAALGRNPALYPPLIAFEQGRRDTKNLLDGWRRDLPEALWDYIVIKGCLDGTVQARSVETQIVALLDTTPELRGALAERIWALAAQANSRPENSPWLHDRLFQLKTGLNVSFGCVGSGVFGEIWKALLAKPCLFAPEFALTLLREADHAFWPEHVTFAQSLAASLPRTDEARAAVEHVFARRLSAHTTPTRRAFERQRLALTAALAQPVAATEAAPRALEAFEEAFKQARAKEAEARALRASMEKNVSGLNEVMKRLASFPAATHERGSRDIVLGGPNERRALLTCAATAIKLNPATPALRERLDAIEAALCVARDESGLPPGGDLATWAPWISGQFAALSALRALIDLFEALTPAMREQFTALEDFAVRAPNAATPPRKWLAAAEKLAKGQPAFLREKLFAFMAFDHFVERDGNGVAMIFSQSVAMRRGLVWLCALLPAPEALKPLTSLALRALAPDGWRGIANEMLGNACLWSLANLPEGTGLSALARIAARSRYPKVRQRINGLFEEAAQKAGRPRAEIEEEIAPHHGFVDGVSIVTLAGGAGKAEIRLDARGKADVVWRDGAGKALKSPSEKMKQADAQGVKAVRGLLREFETDYGVEARRVERLFREDRALDYARWHEFYADHPFVGLIARRVIWRNGDLSGLWRDGAFEDVTGGRHDISAARLRLWHPIAAEDTEIAAWRALLEFLGVDQPFRQAWRETYRATEAERANGDYSNRFAGHIVRQHQFMTLARLNDWHCRHRMWQDVKNDEPTFVAFPDFGVYAEFWTAGAGGDDPPLADSSAYLYLSTDRIVFHRLNEGTAPNKPAELRGARLAIDEVPPQAFSEIMRSCDLFVAVASIARDAHWLDRGAQAEHPNQWREQADAYWRLAATAPLEGNARQRHAVLARVLPALGFGDAVTLDDRFLNVRGKRGDYRIHLGSGASFHASGRHICIVTDSAPKKLALPYEGDEILALVLSKALLLLRDDKITDPVIIQQL